MFEIPKAEGFLYCITLKFGVYLVCLFHIFSSVFTFVSFGILLLDPSLLTDSSSKSDILWTKPESIPSLKAHLLLAFVTFIMACIGTMGVRFSPSVEYVGIDADACNWIYFQDRKHRETSGMAELADDPNLSASSAGLLSK